MSDGVEDKELLSIARSKLLKAGEDHMPMSHVGHDD